MKIVEEMLLRQAITLSAIIGDHSESLKKLTVSFMKSEFGLDIPPEEVYNVLEREKTARLFFAVGKTNPNEIRNPQNCLRFARNLWLDYSMVSSSELTADFFEKEAAEKFRKEKALNTTLETEISPLSSIIKRLFFNPEVAQEYKNFSQKSAQYFQAAFYILDEFFTNKAEKPLFDIYNPFFATANESVEPETTAPAESTNKKRDAKIKYLEKSVHDFKVKLEYAQKDAIRDIVMTLSSSGFGSPLFELHSIKKDESTPDHISSAISNLFLALEALDIRISKDSLVGKTMTFDEIEDGKFCLQNDDVLEPSDSVTVKYPGIKLGKETIVKPTIAKEV